nr:aldo/keto reductase [Corynebacterium gerontici]
MSDSQLQIPTITLNDGTEMPALGFGTWNLEGEDCVRAVRSAIEVGYRHIDTAAIYKNEEAVGRAVREAISAGDVTREELFITSKVWNNEQGDQEVQQAFQKSLKRLEMEFIDCMMIHWPWPQRGLYLESYEALAKIQGLGQVRSIAVANFYPELLREITEATGIAPVLNQVELHPGFSQADLREAHDEMGIVTEAWSPLGRGDLLEHELIRGIAEEVGKTPAQVILRWIVQLGCSVIPKSSSRKRQLENGDIFSFELCDEHMQAITDLDASGGRLYQSPLEFPGEVRS